MKKLMILILSLMITMTHLAQNAITEAEVSRGTNKQNICSPKYQLIPTEIRWSYIKINTRNGLMWHVKIDIEENNRFENYLNTLALVDKKKEENGRFKLYSTNNIYTFILLDQIDGRVWQVFWSEEDDNIELILIE